ncbi:hypothetical protein [Mycobacterium paraffinicum]|uniref:Alpha/beta hydrolase n=1 Tax=Mycobacterium paraffinicum TaxID=53378 RepID=A0ABP8EZU9_9MYCO|nr:hypothetical protein [Mycobacterium paraffinicum]MCV7311792.1 hypothetical protein [Mycobacterium paraffinicum]
MRSKSVVRQRPQRPEPPEPVYSQAEQRERRRKWLPVVYRGGFDLAAEVGAIVEPLADQVAALARPLAVRSQVDSMADAVHELLSAVVGMLAESALLGSDAHARTVQAVRDLARRPREPQFTDEHIISGRWAAVLVKHVAVHSDDLSAFLGRALPPNHPHLKCASASERLEAALRILDTAALDLTRLIPKVARHQSLPSIEAINAATRARQERDRAQRALAKMKTGITR